MRITYKPGRPVPHWFAFQHHEQPSKPGRCTCGAVLLENGKWLKR